MMMLAISFSTLKDKILSGEKKQTIRPYSDYWLKFKKGDRAVGYWKMRTPECEKLFESVFSERPFVISFSDFDNELMVKDGFASIHEAIYNWFLPKYNKELANMDFVVLRWE